VNLDRFNPLVVEHLDECAAREFRAAISDARPQGSETGDSGGCGTLIHGGRQPAFDADRHRASIPFIGSAVRPHAGGTNDDGVIGEADGCGQPTRGLGGILVSGDLD
jgi:hypothetical protein